MGSDEKINQDILPEQLVKLGYLFPRNEKELEDFNKEFSSYDYKLRNFKVDPHALFSPNTPCSKTQVVSIEKSAKYPYFKRLVLAAEIVSQLHAEPTFGHVKFQKLVFLCEQSASIKLDHLYQKQAAGPYDRRFMHTIDLQLEKQKWFKAEHETCDGFNRFKYIPLENHEKYKQYYSRYFSSSDIKIQWIINFFRKEKTNYVELIATLFACWLEIINKDEPFSKDLIISKFYSWSKEKCKFSPSQVDSAINWMIDQEFIPNHI